MQWAGPFAKRATTQLNRLDSNHRLDLSEQDQDRITQTARASLAAPTWPEIL